MITKLVNRIEDEMDFALFFHQVVTDAIPINTDTRILKFAPSAPHMNFTRTQYSFQLLT